MESQETIIVQRSQLVPEIESRGRQVLIEAQALVICDSISAEAAVDFTKTCRKALARAEDDRKAITGPINDSIKLINAKYQKLREPFEAAQRIVDQKIMQYRSDEMRKAREEAERVAREKKAAEEAQARERAEMLKEMGEGELAAEIVAQAAAAEVVPERTPEQAKIARSFSALATTQKRWTFEIEEGGEAIVPQVYWSIDRAKIATAVKNGVRSIPGVRIYQQESLVVR